MNPTAAAEIRALVAPATPSGVNLPEARLLDPSKADGLMSQIADIVDTFAPPIEGRAQFVSTKADGLTITGVSTTGFLTAMDSATGEYVIAADAADLVLPDGVSPRTIEVWSCVAADNRIQSGNLEELTIEDGGVVTLDVSRCIALAELNLADNAGMTSLGTITALVNLAVLDVAGAVLLATINAPSLSLITIDVTDCAALSDIDLSGNALNEANIDGLFIPLVPELEGTIICDGGTNAAPSGASDAKITALETAGWTVTVTP